jgi:hypothetical protein
MISLDLVRHVIVVMLLSLAWYAYFIAHALDLIPKSLLRFAMGNCRTFFDTEFAFGCRFAVSGIPLWLLLGFSAAILMNSRHVVRWMLLVSAATSIPAILRLPDLQFFICSPDR